MTKVLFILKRREDYNSKLHSSVGMSTGLYNSAKFMNDMLNENGISSIMEVAIDNNCINHFVSLHKPTHVIIEALWVVPTKFSELHRLHPDVKWIIRLHSEIPFIAGEGMAMDWIGDYTNFKNVIIAVNSPRMKNDIQFFQNILGRDDAIYLPNYYPQDYKTKVFDTNKEFIDIGCFGAVRLLKNHLIQAIAAIDFANRINKKLRFHINAGRIEMKGDAVVKNLKTLFEQIYDSGHRLINHQWTPREQFLELCGQMDIGLQVSFSETFNIVAADLISQGVPVVGSSEIPWIYCHADPTNRSNITYKLLEAHVASKVNVENNQRLLTKYTDKTKNIWLNYFKEIENA